jgi:beta-lactamase regulating signal transducer with metallopeptidase domain
MTLLWTTPASWLLHTAVGGGLLLLLTGFVIRWTRQPARRQRLAELGLAAALLLAVLSLGPPWLHVRLGPSAQEPPPPPTSQPLDKPRPPEPLPRALAALADFDAEPAPEPARELAEAGPENPTSAQAPPEEVESAGKATPFDPETLGALAVGAFLVCSAFLTLRWLVGLLALERLLRSAGPAPDAVRHLFEAMPYRGRRRPRLLVSRRLPVPVSCGLLRPTVVLPAGLAAVADVQTLRWIFAHELTHLERRDACSCWLFGLGQLVYFYLPWFWKLRRQVRLCQEYIADAAVTGQGPAAADYAAFLLKLSKKPALPAGATGVLGNTSDLFRRVSMLLQEPLRVEKRCPRRWSLAAAAGLLSLAVVASGIGLGVDPARASAEEEKVAEQDIRVVVVPAEKITEKHQAPKHVRVIVVAQPQKGAKAEKKAEKVIIRVIKVDGDHEAVVETKAAAEKRLDAVLKVLKEIAPDTDPVRFRVALTRALQKLPRAKIAVEAGHRDTRLPYVIAKGPDDARAIEAVRKALRQLGRNASQADVEQAVARALAALNKARAVKLPRHAVSPVKTIVLDPNEFAGNPEAVRRLLKKLHGGHIPGGAKAKLLESLKKQFPDLVRGKALVLAEGDGKDLEKEIARIMAQIKAQQAKLKALQRAMDQRRAEFLKANAKWLADNHGKLGTVRLGIVVAPPGEALADQLELPKGRGLVIVKVLPMSAAAKAGLKANDILLGLNGNPVASSPVVLIKSLGAAKPGAPLVVVVLRKGKKLAIKGLTVPGAESEKDDPAAWKKKLKNKFKQNEKKVGKLVTVNRTTVTQFTTRYQEGDLAITLNGSVAQGKVQVESIVVQDGKAKNKYASLHNVPAQYRARVKDLLKISVKDNTPNKGK